MSTLAVVEAILRNSAVPLSVREIVERAGDTLPTKSKTPDTVVARDLSMDIKKRGDGSLFMRTSPGRYAIRDQVLRQGDGVAGVDGSTAAVYAPVSVPTGPRGEAVTAAYASMRPSPQTLLSPAVPPQVRSAMSTAVWSRSWRVWAMSPMSDGAEACINATTPATCGAAIEVPLKLA